MVIISAWSNFIKEPIDILTGLFVIIISIVSIPSTGFMFTILTVPGSHGFGWSDLVAVAVAASAFRLIGGRAVDVDADADADDCGKTLLGDDCDDDCDDGTIGNNLFDFGGSAAAAAAAAAVDSAIRVVVDFDGRGDDGGDNFDIL